MHDDDIRDAIKAAPDAVPVPTIVVEAGLRHEAAHAGLAALHAAGVAFYQRHRDMVRVCPIKAKASDGATVFVPGITPVSPPTMARALGLAAHWQRLNAKGKPITIDPPP